MFGLQSCVILLGALDEESDDFFIEPEVGIVQNVVTADVGEAEALGGNVAIMSTTPCMRGVIVSDSSRR